MIVLSRDGNWLRRLERLALRGGWPFAALASLPEPALRPPPERELAVLDRGLAGAVPRKGVASLRALYPGAAIALAFDASEMDHDAVTTAVSCGADEVLGKSWPDEKLSTRLALLRDRALEGRARYSTNGSLKADRRSHRAFINSRGRWKELDLDAVGFALLWRLLEREGEVVSRAELGEALAAVAGREREVETITRRLGALKKTLARWPGAIESARGGLYRLVSAPRRAENPSK